MWVQGQAWGPLGRVVGRWTPARAASHRGQGLYVARTYMAKMGGTIALHNEPQGVVVVLGLQRG